MSILSKTRFILPIIFLLAGVFGLWTHHAWQNETGMWAAFHTSNSFHELIARMGYTGHTLTFLIWQYGLYQFFHTPLAGSIANLLFMTAAIALFARTSPFTPLQKWLFAMGFFPLYQYAIVSRMFGYLIFFLFAYCALYVTKPKRVLLRWLMLIAMAETHVVGMLAAVPIAALDMIRHWKEETNTWLEKLFCTFKLSFFIFAIASAVWQVWPEDLHYHLLHPENPFLFLLGLTDGFFPNYGIFADSIFQTIAGAIAFCLALAVIYPCAAARLNFILFSIPLLLFSAVIYVGDRWHFGSYWIYWIMAIWLAGPQNMNDQKLKKPITALFAAHAAFGLYAIINGIQ